MIAACAADADRGHRPRRRDAIVHLGPTTFVPAVVTVRAGEHVVMVEDAPIPHFIRNGHWRNDVPEMTRESGAPTIDAASPTVLSKSARSRGSCTYYLYCTVHPNMNLTVQVQ